MDVLIVIAVISIGFYYYLWKAWNSRPKEMNLSTYLLGGKKIGADLTTHTNWGIGFSFANGLWFCAFLGYNFGWYVIPIQFVWSLSIAFLFFFVRRVIKVTEKGNTIHGFLADKYSSKTQVIAACSTTLGYLLNSGFEIYFSTILFLTVLGLSQYAFVVSLLFALFCASYCLIGGYTANVQTDKPQNIIGMIAVSLLMIFLFINLGSDSVSRAVLTSNLSFSQLPPLDMLLGLVVFMLFFNLVDMANWQIIAANSSISGDQVKSVKISFVKSAVYQMFFPSLFGGLLGMALRLIKDINQNEYFINAFALFLPHSNILLRSLLIGFILLGLLSLTLSSVDSYILAAIHTIASDILFRKKYNSILNETDIEKRLIMEADFIQLIKPLILLISVVMIITFFFFFKIFPDNVFQIQFIMYGCAISLLPSVIFALFKDKLPSAPKTEAMHLWSFLSVLFGVIAGLLPYLILSFFYKKDYSNYSPFFSLLASSLVFLVGLYFKRKRKDNANVQLG